MLNKEFEVRTSDSECQLDACLRGTVKLQRAYGGCLGDKRRRRTWTAAKSFGELLTSVDPKISESGNRLGVSQGAITESIGDERPTRGTETSKYPEEKKSTETPQVAASEKGPA